MRGSVAAKALLNRAEQMLYGRLVRAFPGHIVLSQVALSRLLVDAAPSPTAPGGGARFGQLVADFVVCRADFTAVAVVELHQGADCRAARPERLRRKENYLRAAGVKMVRFAAHDLPTEAALRALVAALPPHSSRLLPVRHAS